LKQRLLWIFSQRERLGYGHIAVAESVIRQIERWDL
jgi:hypothetical protein